MKKKMICIMSAVLCLSLTACGGTKSGNTESDSKVSEESSKTDSKEITVTTEELQGYLEEVTLTSDNWEDYFKVEDYSYVAQDNSGGKTGESVNSKILTENENVVASNDLVLGFTYSETCTGANYFDKDTGEEITDNTNAAQYIGTVSEGEVQINGNALNAGMPSDNSYAKGITLYSEKTVDSSLYGIGDRWALLEKTCDVTDLKLGSVTGTVNLVKIPEDKWNTDKEHGKYLVVEDDGMNYYLFESGAYGFGSVEDMNWDDEYLGDNGYASWPWESFSK